MKTKTILIGIFAALAVGIGATTVVLINTDKGAEPQTSQEQTTNTDTLNQSDTVTFTAEAGKTVLDQLTAREAVETKDSSYGTYVDAINGKKGGEDGKYWTYYIDGELAQVGADQYTTQGGETIEWRFE